MIAYFTLRESIAESGVYLLLDIIQGLRKAIDLNTVLLVRFISEKITLMP